MSSEPTDEPTSRNFFTAWVHANPRQAVLTGLVLSLLIFALIRGFASDTATLTQLTETAKERWTLIQESQESYYATNGRYAEELEALEGASDALSTPDEDLDLSIELSAGGEQVEMTMSGSTITLSRTLTRGEETGESCLIRVAQAGAC